MKFGSCGSGFQLRQDAAPTVIIKAKSILPI
jgi:hypothetical protein